MSSEGENGKNQELEGSDAKTEDELDSVVKKPAVENNKADETKTSEKDDKKEVAVEENDKKTSDDKKADKDDKKELSKVEKEEDGSEEAGESDKEDEKNDDDDADEESEKAPSKEKKKPLKEEKDKDAKTEIPEGSGTQLGEIPRIDASISRFKNDDLKLLHRLLFKAQGKTALIKKNIRKFNGFDFKKDSKDYKEKLASVEKFEIKQLRIICEMLDLEKKGGKDEMSQRILEFLIEPKDSGKGAGGGRPRRSAAVKANNRGYSSYDESYSSDEKTPRARRNAGKRANLKEETSSESDEDFHLSDNSEEDRPAVKKRKRGGRKKKEESDEDDVSDVVDSPSTEESDDGPKSKKKKVVNSKVKGKVATPVVKSGRGRKPAAATAAAAKKKAPPAKRGRKRGKESSEEEDEESGHDEEGSSSEDEPLAKKTAKAPQPPTDEEIKTYVKEILEGANLEEITMKTVCKQVYAHYPDFDLTHKKDYIKTTVKSLIST